MTSFIKFIIRSTQMFAWYFSNILFWRDTLYRAINFSVVIAIKKMSLGQLLCTTLTKILVLSYCHVMFISYPLVPVS